MRSNLTDIEVEVHHETEKGLLVSLDGEKENAQWLPKSLIEVEFDASALYKRRGIAVVTLPVRLAKEKGLI